MPNRLIDSNGGGPVADANYQFLSPDWVSRVAERVGAHRESDAYFGSLVSAISLTVIYVISEIPRQVEEWYGPGGNAVLAVRLRRGEIERIDIAGTPPSTTEAHVLVRTRYEVARRLFMGKLSTASSVLNRAVVAEPVNGLEQWPTLATKSLVVASRVLRTARKVPTEF